MADKELERQYEQLVEQSKLRGEAEPDRAALERRHEVRIQPDAASVIVGDDPWVYPINVSRAGVAFHSDVAHSPGTELTVRLEGGPGIEAVVVACVPETGEPAAVAGAFRISCAFKDPEAGLRFFLALKSLEAAELEPGE